MVSGNPLLWEVSPTVTLQSMLDSPSHTVATSYTDDSPQSALSSCPSDCDAFSQSTHSPYVGVLRQLMATPSPGTAAAMVCTPLVSSGQLMETQGPDSNAAVQKTPLASSSGKLVRTLYCNAAAALVRSPSLLSEQRLVPTSAPPPFMPATSQACASLDGQPSSTHGQGAKLQILCQFCCKAVSD